MSSSGDAGRGPRPSAAASWPRSATATRKRPRPTFSAGTAPLVRAASTRDGWAPRARAASSTSSRPSLPGTPGPLAVGAGDEAGTVPGAVAPGQVAVAAGHAPAAAQASGTLLAAEEGPAAAVGEVAERDGVGRGRASLGRHKRGDHRGILEEERRKGSVIAPGDGASSRRATGSGIVADGPGSTGWPASHPDRFAGRRRRGTPGAA